MKWLFPIVFIVFSCAEGVPRGEAPADLIPRQQMVELLTELSKLEAHIQITHVSVDRYHKVMKNSGDSLMKAKGVSYEQFEKSMDYYAARQEEMIGIYDDVLEELNQDLGEVQSKD